jgi:uncharacterized repeat protein (TIGR01451 family)
MRSGTTSTFARILALGHLAPILLVASLIVIGASSVASAETVTLHSVTKDTNAQTLTVIYSKDFATCAHLVTSSFQITHSNNFFCTQGNNVSVTQPLSAFPLIQNGSVSSVKLCNGNNYGVCSALVEIVGGEPPPPPPAPRQQYDAFADFSFASNPTADDAWRYGYKTTLTGTLNLYTIPLVAFDLSHWTSPIGIDPNVIKNETGETIDVFGAIRFPAEDFLHFHPGPSGQFSVVRWTAPAAGRYDIRAAFKSLRFSGSMTTSTVYVLRNTTQIFTASINGYISNTERLFSTLLTLNAGETIDFAVGVGTGGYANDSTGLKASITKSDSVPPQMYGLKSAAGPSLGDPSNPPTSLFKFAENGSSVVTVGSVKVGGLTIDADGLAISPSLGLYAFQLNNIGGANESSTLIQIEKSNAVATVVGPSLQLREIRGAVFDHLNRLWALDRNNRELLQIDPATGGIVGSPVPLTLNGTRVAPTNDLDIAERADGTFFVNINSNVYIVDITTGTLTFQFLDDIQNSADGTPLIHIAGIAFSANAGLNDLFAYDINGGEDIFRYDVTLGDNSRLKIYANLPPSFNAGRGDLAAVVEFQMADLSISKTGPTNPVAVGSDAIYTIQVTNHGPENASDVTVTDALPAGVTLVSASSGCAGTSTVTCVLGDMARDDTTTLSVVVHVTEDADPVLTNTATVSTTTLEPDTTNNSAAATTTVLIESIPPTTTATPSPGPNAAGWNNTPVTVDLAATDEAGGSGVKEIRFILSGAQPGVGIVSGDSASVVISAEGSTTVSFFAVDYAGNQESPKSITVNIDTIKPTLTLPDNQTVEATNSSGATVTYPPATATDAGSTPVISYSQASGTLFAIGTTSVEVTAADAAENSTAGTFSVTVTRRTTTLAVAMAAGIYGGTTTLQATLSANGTPVAAQPVSFTLHGASVGIVPTDANGVATLFDVSLAGINASAVPYADAVGASFTGDVTFKPSSGTAALSVARAPASVTPDAKSKIYGDSDPALTGTLVGFLAADNVTATYDRAAGETVPGPYEITATLSPAAALSNYDITYNTAGLTITPRAASVTPNAASKIYGDLDPALTGTLTGFLPADGVTATYARAVGETVPGPYQITATLSPTGVLSNYNITYNTASFTITPRAASATPNAASKIYGDIDPVLTGMLTGFLPADGVTATYSRTPGENVLGGPYVISATLSPAAVLSNYNITSNTAAFTIVPAATTTTVASSINPAGPTDTITFTATIAIVAPGGGIPGGMVEFYDGATSIGTGPVGTSGGSFIATLTPTLGGGDHSISARYLGTDNHLGSTSPTISQTVFGPPSEPGRPDNPGPPDTLPNGGSPGAGRPGGAPPR